MRSRSLALVTAAALCGTAGLATAQPEAAGGNIDLNVFRPAIDSRGYLTINASQPLGHLEVSFGLGSIAWGHSVMELDANGDSLHVSDIVSATLIAAIGFKIGPAELELGASAPAVIMFADRSPDDLGDPNTPNDDKRFKLSGQGIGNVGVHLKTRFTKTTRGPRIGSGVIISAFLPTVSEKGRFLGDEKTTFQVMGIVDKEFGRQGRFRAALNAGIRIRGEQAGFIDIGDPEEPTSPATGEIVSYKNEIPVGLGLAYAVRPQKFDVVAEVFGAIPIGDHENYFPLEAIGGAKVYLARNSFLSLGGGLGLMPGKAGNPDFRAFLGIVFEPSIGDRDGDGLKDDVDDCPDEPEDYDGFRDKDGCPEPDNDNDLILDVDDDCPNVPETKNKFQDEDGCPDGVKGDRDGDGILDEVDQCPDDPEDLDEFEDADGCPDPDNDQDQILDVDDLCINDPEDRDGWEDEDGCPDPDNDKDRILDNDDKCPNEPETYNGTEDEDGCPDRGRVVVTDTNIEILDMVYFELDKAIIKKESYPILDAVAATLEGNPGISLIEIQGHTDEQGNDAYNLDLSDRRAASVREYLIGKGIAEARLTSQGYGESQPVDRRKNKAAYAKNRRVAFLILKRETD
jgi:OOP family OmpA-OmpF porin